MFSFIQLPAKNTFCMIAIHDIVFTLPTYTHTDIQYVLIDCNIYLNTGRNMKLTIK